MAVGAVDCSIVPACIDGLVVIGLDMFCRLFLVEFGPDSGVRGVRKVGGLVMAVDA